MRKHISFAEVGAILDGLNLDNPNSIGAIRSVQASLEEIEPPKGKEEVQLLSILIMTAQKLHEDLVRIHGHRSMQDLTPP